MIIASFFEVPTLQDLLALKPNVKAIFFDMDGTLIDSEKEHANATIAVLKQHIGPFEEKKIHSLVYGKPDPYGFERLKEEFAELTLDLNTFLDYKHKALEAMFQESTGHQIPVTLDLLKQIKSLRPDLLIAVVTASERKTAISALSRHFTGYFSHLVARDDIPKSKPFPEPYFKALELFGLTTFDEVLIVEDSPTGLASALASGASVLRAYWYRVE